MIASGTHPAFQHIGELKAAVMRRKRVAAYLDISLATLDRLRADPASNFPAPIRLGEQAIGWRLGAIEEWLASRPLVLH